MVLKKLFLFSETALPGNQLLGKLLRPVKLDLGLRSLMAKTSQTYLRQMKFLTAVWVTVEH